jgi:anti-sigma regulatory factor (Ser/Thr protein kinase)
VTSYSAASYSSAPACPSCSAPFADDAKGSLVPGAKHDLSRTLRAQPQAAAEARRAVATLPLPERRRDTLSLIASELVTNSVLHAGVTAQDLLDLHVDHGGPQVRIAVHDGGPGFTPPGSDADPLAVGGRGLVIAAALSDSWGVDCDERGCTVWCDLLNDEKPEAIPGQEPASGHAAELALEVAEAERQTRLELPPRRARMNASCPP